MKSKMDELFKKIDEKGLKVKFGLEAQGHIETIEAVIKDRQNSMNESFPDDGINVMYSKYVWDEIGRAIGWCPLTAALHYFNHLSSIQTVHPNNEL